MTLIRFLATMRPKMMFKNTIRRKLFLAYITSNTPLFRVRPYMRLKLALQIKRLITHSALDIFLRIMHPLVEIKATIFRVRLVAFLAVERSIRVVVRVNLQTPLRFETFLAHLALVFLLVGMYQ